MQKQKTKTNGASGLPDVLSQRQAAKFLGTSEPTLRRALRSGSSIPFRKLGSRYLFSRDALGLWLMGQEGGGS